MAVDEQNMTFMGLPRTNTERQRFLAPPKARSPWWRRNRAYYSTVVSEEALPPQRLSLNDILQTISRDSSDQTRFIDNFRQISKRSQRGSFQSFFVYQSQNAHEPDFKEDSTWRTCFETACNLLQTNSSSPGLELVAISAEIPGMDRTFSFVQNMLFVNKKRMRYAYDSPKIVAALATCLVWAWKEPWPERIFPLLGPPMNTPSVFKPQFPSQVKTPAAFDPYIAEKTVTFLDDCTSLDEELEVFQLRFPASTPQFITDLHVYVWQPHVQYPELEELNIFLRLPSQHIGSRLLLLSRMSTTISGLRELGTFLSSTDGPTVPHPELWKVINCILLHVRSQTARFLEGCSKELNHMNFEGRRAPSGSKIQYLEHLRDHIRCVEASWTSNNESVLRLIQSLGTLAGVSQTDTDSPGLEKVQGYVEDLKYLKNEASAMLSRLDEVQKGIKSQLELTQIRRSVILGIFAGLYVPLAFVTSFFGMNVNQIGDSKVSWTNTSVWTNTTSFDVTKSLVPTDISFANYTASRIQSDAPQTWNISLFWAIAIPLMIGTILLPLTVGALIRAMLQFVTSKRFIWRPLFAGISLVALILNGIKFRQYYNLYGPLEAESASYDKSFGFFPEEMPYWFFDFVVSVVVWILFGGLISWNLVMAINSRTKKYVLFWIAHSGIFVALIMLIELFPLAEWDSGDHQPLWAIPLFVSMSVLYWVFLIGTWWWKPELYHRWDDRRRKVKTQ